VSEDFRLAEKDVRALVRILGATVEISGANEQRSYLMRRLAELIGADFWIWGVSPLMEAGKQPVYLFHHNGGFDSPRMARFLEAVEHPDTGEMTIPIIRAMAESGGQVTRSRGQIIPDERFMMSPARPYWEVADIGPLMLSIRPLPGYGISVVGFYRRPEAAAFGTRETKIAHIVLTEVPWLHHVNLPHQAAASAPQLPPRCRLVLNHLVLGRTRREIAEDLQVSVQTVNDYLKRIYRHFGVHSQSELIARFTRGNGGDG